jgi:hypothetical protein
MLTSCHQVCADCESRIVTYSRLCETAQRSAVESDKLLKTRKRRGLRERGDNEEEERPSKRSRPDYNYARLRVQLADHAYDESGNCGVHVHCLAAGFGVGFNFLSRVHIYAITSRRAPMLELRALRVLSSGWEDRVVVPSTFLGSPKGYLASLGDQTLVRITRPPTIIISNLYLVFTKSQVIPLSNIFIYK